MLQSIREHLHGWIAGIILAILVASFLLFGIQYYLQAGSPGSAAVATVNGEKITNQAWDTSYQTLRDQTQAASPVPITLSMQADLRKMALQRLITQATIRTGMAKAGWVATPDQIQALLNTIPAFQVNGQFSQARYEELLSMNGLTPAQFTQQMQTDIVSQQLQAGLEQSSFILPNEVLAGFSLLRQTRDFGYMIVPASDFLNKVTVSDASIQAYYNAHMRLWVTPEQVSIQYLTLSPTQLATEVKVTDAQIQQYYQTHLDHFRGAHVWQVKELSVPLTTTNANTIMQGWVKQLEAGKSFASVGPAKTVTLDAGKDTDPKLVDVLMQMQPNQISVPVQTKTALVIVQLVSSQNGAVLPLAQVKSQIQQGLQNQAVERLLSKKSDTLEKLTYTQPDSLAPAAKALNLSIQTTELMTRSGTSKGLLSNPAVVAAAFSKNVLSGDNSQLITLNDGSVMVLRVLQHQAKQIQPLSAVQDKIRKQLLQRAAQNETAKAAHTFELQVVAGSDPATLAKQSGYVWKVVKNQTRNSPGIDSAILTAVFHTAMNTSGNKVADIGLSNGDYGVVQLQAVHLPNPATLTPVMTQALSGQLSQLNQSAEYQLYVRSLKKAARVKKYAS